MKELYKRELLSFFDALKLEVNSNVLERKASGKFFRDPSERFASVRFACRKSVAFGRASASASAGTWVCVAVRASPTDTSRLQKSPSVKSNLSSSEAFGSNPSLAVAERERFQKVIDRHRGLSSDSSPVFVLQLIETVLSELEPVVLSEQKFCVRFFHISSELLLSSETQSVSSTSNLKHMEYAITFFQISF